MADQKQLELTISLGFEDGDLHFNSTISTIKMLQKAIHEEREDEIRIYEESLADSFEEITKDGSVYLLPLKHIIIIADIYSNSGFNDNKKEELILTVFKQISETKSDLRQVDSGISGFLQQNT